ncbi:hypothetical protein [Sporolactobacillus pectinivorans]|uniref:hypothetical protein n=1 Tax=Sporolactobacillus pectinivorans TaxID=1591408 RepID=UPI0012FE53B3|nr:hypothetical protein [Sporolactobacillus pectinivorans]
MKGKPETGEVGREENDGNDDDEEVGVAHCPFSLQDPNGETMMEFSCFEWKGGKMFTCMSHYRKMI